MVLQIYHFMIPRLWRVTVSQNGSFVPMHVYFTNGFLCASLGRVFCFARDKSNSHVRMGIVDTWATDYRCYDHSFTFRHYNNIVMCTRTHASWPSVKTLRFRRHSNSKRYTVSVGMSWNTIVCVCTRAQTHTSRRYVVSSTWSKSRRKTTHTRSY